MMNCEKLTSYDLESYPNVWTCSAKYECDMLQFEISDRKNQISEFCQWIDELDQRKFKMVGFNNLSFDYPLWYCIYQSQALEPTADEINAWSQKAIRGLIRPAGVIVPQIDLLKVHHFDNKARMTSLKLLEFNMRMSSVEDLPFDFRKTLTNDEIDILLAYNAHDVEATDLFLQKSLGKIQFRLEMSEKLGVDFTNASDVSIGRKYFELRLNQAGIQCRKPNGDPIQTPRDIIPLRDCILDKVRFASDEMNAALTELKTYEITDTIGAVDGVSATLRGFTFHFGLGGIHGCVNSQIIEADDDYMIEDWDVKSYYPINVVRNGFYPEHIGPKFCEIYKELYDDRDNYPKDKFPEINNALKLALNGAGFGETNANFSIVYDPKMTMQVTLNGQLLLCMLAERLMKSDDITMIQANTDGFTIKYPRSMKESVHKVCAKWVEFTGFELETAEYRKMVIRDVNNYIALGVDGKAKLKGAYNTEPEWHKNHSALVVKKAAVANLLYGTPIEEFITGHGDVFDFFLRLKIPKNINVEWNGEKQQKVTRYYVSTGGHILQKVLPPLGTIGEYVTKQKISHTEKQLVEAQVGKGVWDARIHLNTRRKYDHRRTAINKGYTVQICNKIANINDINDINYNFYIAEARKLVEVFNK